MDFRVELEAALDEVAGSAFVTRRIWQVHYRQQGPNFAVLLFNSIGRQVYIRKPGLANRGRPSAFADCHKSNIHV